MLVPLSDTLKANKYAEQHKKSVEKQRTSDLKNRDAILKEMNAFIKKGRTGIHDTKIVFDIPVDMDLVTGIDNTDNYHYAGIIPPKIYGYVNAGSLNMRSEDNSKSEITGKLIFKNMVEILFQSDKIETIDNMKAPWLLVRKDSGEEGWVFGAYVSHDIPTEKDTDAGKTDWGMIIPASGRLSSKFGTRVDPVTKKANSFHQGIDIAAPAGTPVYAAENGKVFEAGWKNDSYGNLIMIQHDADLATYYAHLSKVDTSKGKEVKKGDLIGKVGSTGKSTGPHLHFEVRKGGQALNPEDFVK
jgi:hypothetical protein